MVQVVAQLTELEFVPSLARLMPLQQGEQRSGACALSEDHAVDCDEVTRNLARPAVMMSEELAAAEGAGGVTQHDEPVEQERASDVGLPTSGGNIRCSRQQGTPPSLVPATVAAPARRPVTCYVTHDHAKQHVAAGGHSPAAGGTKQAAISGALMQAIAAGGVGGGTRSGSEALEVLQRYNYWIQGRKKRQGSLCCQSLPAIPCDPAITSSGRRGKSQGLPRIHEALAAATAAAAATVAAARPAVRRASEPGPLPPSGIESMCVILQVHEMLRASRPQLARGSQGMQSQHGTTAVVRCRQ